MRGVSQKVSKSFKKFQKVFGHELFEVLGGTCLEKRVIFVKSRPEPFLRARVWFRRPFSQPRRKGDFPWGVMPQVGFPCVGVLGILEIEPQGGFPFVVVLRGELARGISL